MSDTPDGAIGNSFDDARRGVTTIATTPQQALSGTEIGPGPMAIRLRLSWRTATQLGIHLLKQCES